MIIELHSELFNNISNLQEVNQLLGILSDRRRYSYFCDIDIISNTDLYKSLLVIDQELIEEYFNRIMQESSEVDCVVSNNSSDDILNVIEAKRFLNQPVTIILENSLNDGYFIDSICNVYRSRSRTIRRSKEEGWIEYGNAGGCSNIINFINSKLLAFESLPKDNDKYLRCIVIIDSDKRFPTDNKDERTRLIEFLEGHNISYHILEKREMENYIPDMIISNIQYDTDYFRTYTNLNPFQKDFFDIEKGFKNENRDNLLHDISDLYSDLSDKDYGIIRRGVADKSSFKSEIPKLFIHVTKAQFQERTKHQTNPQELENILDQITELL